MAKKEPTKEELWEFIQESNAIEGVYDLDAADEAMLAWEYAGLQKEMTVPRILQIHRILMARLNPRIAGQVRHVDVWIGGKKKKFISVYTIEQNLQAVCDMMNKIKKTKKQAETLSDITHILFEEVHPFEDGNGRVGRILWNWHRLKLGLPIRIVHEGEEQIEYYKMFREPKS